MEVYVEKKRERRIRDSHRMLKRAERFSRFTGWPRAPEPHDPNRPRDWEEVFAERRDSARRCANNLRICSCSMCGNPRRQWGDRTYQECRRGLATVEQLVEAGFLDDCCAVRKIRRQSNWF